MLIDLKIENNNVQVTFKENDTLWGISFIKSDDNSEELALIESHATDEEMATIRAELTK